MDSFQDKVVLITGAASGLGRQLAHDFVIAGARVAALDRSTEGLATLQEELDGRLLVTAAGDVTDRDSLRQAIGRLESTLGPTDLLIAGAGIGQETSAIAFDAARVEEQLRVNLVGVSNTLGAVLPGMVQRRRGHIAALSSLASYRGLPRMAAYCASKAGVNALLESLRFELEPRGIAVTILCPGWVRTPMTASIPLPPSQFMTVQDASRLIMNSLRQRQRFFAFPAGMRFRMRLLHWLPPAASDWIVRRALAAVPPDHRRP